MGRVKRHLEDIIEAAFYNLELAPSPTFHEAYDTILQHSSYLDESSRQWCEALYLKRCESE